MHFRGLHSVTNLFKPQPSPKGSSLRINRAAKCSQNLHIKETILLKTGLLPCPIHPWESQYEESQLCFLLDVQFSLFLTSSHSNIETFILLIQLWAPHCICERARQGAPCKLCTQEQLHPGHKVGKWLQHRLLFPEPPAGSTCSRSSSSWTQGVLQISLHLRANPSLQRMCGHSIYANAPPPHHPWKLWGLLSTVEWLSKRAKVFSFNENLRRERYKPVKQTNWLSQGSSQKEQAY